jgi:hypothetical protein
MIISSSTSQEIKLVYFDERCGKETAKGLELLKIILLQSLGARK